MFGTNFITKVRSKYPRPRRQNVSKEEMWKKEVLKKIGVGKGKFSIFIRFFSHLVRYSGMATGSWLDWQRHGNGHIAEDTSSTGKKSS